MIEKGELLPACGRVLAQIMAVQAMFLAAAGASAATGGALAATPGRQMETLDRGVVAAPAQDGGVQVSWRLLRSDPSDIGFDVLRDGRKLNDAPIRKATAFVDKAGQPGARYEVRIAGQDRALAHGTATAWQQGYLEIPLSMPPGGTTPDGKSYGYTANDASVGDLDGDGRYEVVLKWDPTNSKDNSQPGYTGNVLLDAYTLDGKRLWRIDLGPNIRAGAHYTQFQVFDYDGDGRAELVVKTADGTIDGQGQVIGDAKADWRGKDGEVPQRDRTGAVVKADGSMVAPLAGRILKGPEYLTVFDGRTGGAIDTKPYDPPRYPGGNPTTEQLTESWGDGYGNRSDRFLAGTAYLDGVHPTIIMGRGYYARTVVAAWDFRNGKLVKRWTFDSSAPGNADYAGRGNHQLSIADVDGDGRDEVIYGSMALDDDGSGLWTDPLFHGDAMHVGDLDPGRPGLEKFGVFEDIRRNGGLGSALLDARTGQILWTTKADRDTGRGLAADIDPRHPGAEMWSSNSAELYDVHGQTIGPRPRETNFAIWWDGDLLRELLDKTMISKWNWKSGTSEPLLVAQGVASNNGTKANPALSADLFGDWREEVMWRTADSSALRIFETPYSTRYRFVTLMQDPVYRLGVAWQNTAYNQPPHLSFDLATTAGASD